MSAQLIRAASRWSPAVLGGLALALLACGPSTPAGEPSFERIEWRPAAGAEPWPRAVVVERLDMLDDQLPWTFEADEVVRFARPVGRPDAAPSVRLRCEPTGDGIRVHLDRALDISAVNELRLLLEAAGPGDLRAELWREGELIGLSLPTQLLVATTPRPVVLSLPRQLTNGGVADRLTLKASSSARGLGLYELELLSRPPEAWLPDPAGAPGLVAIGGDARRALGLSSTTELVAEVDVPVGAQLGFSFGQPVECRRANAWSTLQLEARAGELTASGRWTLDSSAGLPSWREATLDLSALAGRRATLRASIVSEDGRPAAVALAESQLWVEDARPPTIVLLTSDTHRYDHQGHVPGGVEVSTPVLDALAARGVAFDDCLSVTNVTNPSHAALLTGVHPRDLGLLRNNLPLNERATTLASVLAAQGFVTQAVVSARHLGPRTSGLGRGFDRMAWPEPDGERSADQAIDLALEGLGAARGRPLFLWLHVFDVHGPYDPPASYRRLYWDEGRDPFDAALPATGLPDSVLPDHLAGLRDKAWPEAAYRGEVSWVDAQLAQLLAAPRLAQAVLAFTADHGESLGQHGIWYGHAGLYPDSLHVPLVLAFPGAPAGRRVTAPVSHLDLGATLLDLAGVPAGELPGRSFAALARGGEAPARPAPRFALSAHGFSAAVQEGQLLLLLQLRTQKQPNMERRLERHTVQLFDLVSDPGCLVDLAESRVDDARRLRAGLLTWLGAADDKGWTGELVQDPEVVAQLAQLGYLSSGEAAHNELWVDDDCVACQRFEAGR